MIAQWMFGALVFSALCGIAALAAEHILQLVGRPSRFPWAIALCATLGWPFLAPWVLDARTPEVVAGMTTATDAIDVSFTTTVETSSVLSSLWAGQYDRSLVIGWAIATVLLAVQTLVAIVMLRRIGRRATRMLVNGEPVLIDDMLGPAVIGLVQPTIVVPSWLLELDHHLQSLVLRHEREHCRARDAALVWLSVLATTLVPWNVAMWWMARRLRTAMEIDCDARTLRGVADQSQYAKLLLLIAQHKSSARFAPALSHSTSQLHRRIRAMKTPDVRFRSVHIVVASGIAVLAAATACSTRVATNLTSPANAVATPTAEAATVTTDKYPTPETPPYFDFQVTNPASMAPGSIGPVYPAELRVAKKQGQVLAQFVVNTDGTVDASTIKILKTDDEQFSTAVRDALSAMKFTPATLKGRAVRQLLQQPFMFSMGDNRSGAAPTPSTVPQSPDVDAPVLIPAALRAGSAGPAYPKTLKDAQLEGQVFAQFVVGRDGKVEMSTLKVLKSDHDLFTAAVRTALESMQFDPATKDGEPVKELRHMPFQFSIPKDL